MEYNLKTTFKYGCETSKCYLTTISWYYIIDYQDLMSFHLFNSWITSRSLKDRIDKKLAIRYG